MIRQYLLTIYFIDGSIETYVIGQQYSSKPSTIILAYKQALRILDGVESISSYTLERKYK